MNIADALAEQQRKMDEWYAARRAEYEACVQFAEKHGFDAWRAKYCADGDGAPKGLKHWMEATT